MVFDRYIELFRTYRKFTQTGCFYGPLFFMRRYIILCVLIYAPNSVNVQIFVHMLLTSINLLFLVHNQPFDRKLLNTQEIFNEAIVLLSSYPLLTFNLWVEPKERQ